MAVKGFTAEAVKREHISPITLLYGNDSPGIALRIQRFKDILEENNERPNTFNTTKDAISYLQCGDLFTNQVCCIIKDASDITKTTSESTQLRKLFLSLIKTYDETSTIVIGLPVKSNTQTVQKITDFFRKINALVRPVVLPSKEELALWLIEYAKSLHDELNIETATKIVETADCDVDIMKTIYHSVGKEAQYLSSEEMREWIDTEDEIKPSDLRRFILKGDIKSIEHAKERFTTNSTGYRVFLMKLRLGVFDSLVAALSHGNDRPLATLKAAQYGRVSGIYYYMDEVKFDEADKKLLDIYQAIEDEISFVGGGTTTPSYQKILRAISALSPNVNEYKREKSRQYYIEIAPIPPSKVDEAIAKYTPIYGE